MLITKSKWDLQSAINIIKKFESIAPKYGCHVALTGGILYKEGDRKDLDVMFYRIRQEKEINETGLLDELKKLGVVIGETQGWVTKAFINNLAVDLMFPDRSDKDGYGKSPCGQSFIND